MIPRLNDEDIKEIYLIVKKYGSASNSRIGMQQIQIELQMRILDSIKCQ